MENLIKEWKEDQIIDFLNDLSVDDIDFNYLSYLDFESYDDVAEAIEDNNLFDVDVIYHSNAMEYLSDHDPSLQESCSLAGEFGYTAENINSELLASLLATQNNRDSFYEHTAEIGDFFTELDGRLDEINDYIDEESPTEESFKAFLETF